MTTTTHAPSRACYLRGCRLPECERENYRYSKQLGLEHARGERRLHDTTQVRVHIQQLLANNWWFAEIARASKLPTSNVRKIYTVQQHTHKDVALAILSIPITPILRTDRGDRTRATGSTRRLQALAYLGHPYMDIRARTGITEDRLRIITRGLTDTVRPEEARKIAAAYRVLSTKPGRMKQIATAARNKGWHGPLDWDDIDDPDSQPETSGLDGSATGKRPKVYADPARVARLTTEGLSADQIARRIGCHKRTVVRARGRINHPDTERAAA